MKKHIVFIVNPFSGTTDKNSLPDLINNLIDHNQYFYDIQYTEYAGHATKIAHQCVANRIDLVVAVGGDGSVNEIAKALINTDTTLGILPAGSGNGFSMHLGLGRKIKDAIKYLNKGTTITVDTCQVNDMFFINVAGLGFDARIAYLTKANKKRGFLPYFLTAMRQMNKFAPQDLKINIDGKSIEGKYAAVVVANASMYGYYFTISPLSSLQDQEMEVVLIKNAPVYKYLMEGWRFLFRTVHKSPLVETYAGKKITVVNQKADYLHVDGEGFQTNEPLEFKINPNSLKVNVPAVKETKWRM